MEITCLQAGSFRNLLDAPLEFGPGVNVITGDNGQGKTNLLEAIALVCGLPSFRTSDLTVLLAPGEKKAALSARVDPSPDDEKKPADAAGVLACSLDGTSRQMYLNGNRISQLAARSFLPAVFLTGVDRERLAGGPETRRRAIDRLAFVLEPGHARDLQLFEKARTARTRLLSMDRICDPDEMAVYDESFCKHGARVLFNRTRASGALSDQFRKEAEKLRVPFSELSLRLVSDTGTEGTAEVLEKRLEQKLAGCRKEERASGRCLVGPHRNDIEILCNGQRVTERASSGELRLLVLAWTLSEIAILTASRKKHPVFVFDDFDAEWDRRVLCRFAEVLPQKLQIFLTTARPDATALLPSSESRFFTMKRGELSKPYRLERVTGKEPETRLVTLS